MSDAKHTPGPWFVSQTHGCGFAVEASSGVVVAQAQQTRPTRRDSDHDERRANARLIAAAPELLEACQKLAEWDQREKDHAIGFSERIALCDEAFRLMNAAIAKATGGAA